MGGCLDIFTLLYQLSPLSPLWETALYRLKYCLKGPLNSNKPTNPWRGDAYHITDSEFPSVVIRISWYLINVTVPYKSGSQKSAREPENMNQHLHCAFLWVNNTEPT